MDIITFPHFFTVCVVKSIELVLTHTLRLNDVVIVSYSIIHFSSKLVVVAVICNIRSFIQNFYENYKKSQNELVGVRRPRGQKASRCGNQRPSKEVGEIVSLYKPKNLMMMAINVV